MKNKIILYMAIAASLITLTNKTRVYGANKTDVKADACDKKNMKQLINLKSATILADTCIIKKPKMQSSDGSVSYRFYGLADKHSAETGFSGRYNYEYVPRYALNNLC